MTTVHVAMYDTAMAIAGTHQPYKVTPATPAAGASMEAALAAAAYGVLQGLFPNRAALYQTKYDDAQATVHRRRGQGAGRRARQRGGQRDPGRPCQRRARDRAADLRAGHACQGSSAASTRSARTSQYVKPFSIMSASQFRAPAPPALDSATTRPTSTRRATWAAPNSTTRTLEQTEAARFHTEPPPRFWTRNLHQFAMSQPTWPRTPG